MASKICIALSILLMQTMAVWGETPVGPATRPAEMVELKVSLPKMGYDGEWMRFPRWKQERPDAEDCTKGLVPKGFKVPRGTRNLAINRPVTSSDRATLKELEQTTDGDKSGVEESMVVLSPGVQWVQIDLGSSSRLFAILIWHSAAFPDLAKDVIVQVSDDPEFEKGVKTIFNNDQDNSAGMGRGTDREFFTAVGTRIIDAKGISARYVRIFSNGRIDDDMNHYVEIEIHGLPGERSAAEANPVR